MPERVVGLLGSPLEGGNTAALLREALRGVVDAGCEAERVLVPFLNIRPCMELFHCREHENCIMEDDMQEMYGKFRELDGLIIATPVMTMGVPGALKSFMDRFQVFYMAKYVRNEPLVPAAKRGRRPCLLISISGMSVPNVFDGVKLSVKAFCHIVDCRYEDELLVPGMDGIGDIHSRPDLLAMAYEKGLALGRKIRG